MTLQLNADCGEGDAAVDALALATVDAINVAVGGHAGDPQLARHLATAAQAQGVAVHVHPSYPDRAQFGRRSLALPWPELARSLSAQRAVLPEVQVCKFHGALYNDAVQDHALAEHLAEWLCAQDFQAVLTPPVSALAQAAAVRGLRVIREGFADRAMCGQPPQLRLLPRAQAGAVFTRPQQLLQRLAEAQRGVVTTQAGECHPWPVDTLCLHGDGPQAMTFLRLARQWRDQHP